MQSQQDTITPFQILGGEAQVVQVKEIHLLILWYNAISSFLTLTTIHRFLADNVKARGESHR